MTVEIPRGRAFELRHTDDKADDWPVFPFLPLVRPTGQEPPEHLDVGLLIDGHGDRVVLANLVDAMTQAMMAGGTDAAEFVGWLTETDSIEYPDFQAALDDGWIID